MATTKKLISFNENQVAGLTLLAEREQSNFTAEVSAAVDAYLRLRTGGTFELARQIIAEDETLLEKLSTT